MGYMHIENLYKSKDILAFRECYALEKIHGTSAHIRWADDAVSFFSGGEKHEKFVALFGAAALREKFIALGNATCVVYGEAYGGKQQGMRETYGEALRFVAFDVRVGDVWLAVHSAAALCETLGIEFVYFERGPTDLEWIDAQRDADSTQAIRNGVGTGKKREGVVLRPPFEVTLNSGARVIAKHKRDDFSEVASPRRVMSQEKLRVLADAEAIANEWVTPMRLTHVVGSLTANGETPGMERMGDLIDAMIEDVEREGAGEIVKSREARSAIGKRTAIMFKERLKANLARGAA